MRKDWYERIRYHDAPITTITHLLRFPLHLQRLHTSKRTSTRVDNIDEK